MYRLETIKTHEFCFQAFFFIVQIMFNHLDLQFGWPIIDFESERTILAILSRGY